MASHKIYTDDAYYIVSEDSSMNETELCQLADMIRSSAKITQPNFLIDMRYDYQFVQLQALQKISEQLQPLIKNNLDHNAPGTFPENELEVVIPLQNFGWAKQYYGKLRSALYALATIHVCYPKWSVKIGRTLYGEGPLCTYVAIHRDEQDKRRELVHFFFSQETARCLVSPQFGFTKLLKQTLLNFDSVYTTKIYMYICRVADQGKWVISYKKLREILCVGKRFSRYYDFRRRILKVTEQDLRRNSNHWFDLVECFDINNTSAPRLLIFNIYSTENTYSDIELMHKYKDKIYETMTISLKINKASALSVIRLINIRNFKYIWEKHNMLLAYMAAETENIQDIRAYYIGAIQQIIQTEKYSQPALQQTLF